MSDRVSCGEWRREDPDSGKCCSDVIGYFWIITQVLMYQQTRRFTNGMAHCSQHMYWMKNAVCIHVCLARDQSFLLCITGKPLH
ncbi:hypothetical protein Pmani_000241 [Petrolisthes manimaculis]|uniref:Uncharacterized protein n=1 Tax=Petrolisthes manimaculis TaxID=1843537 RepID=A0AAE1QMG2_9EUCA|nr:hypothetical protein Pmani_000241 [Petrolisthes manimaculis]